MFTKACLKFFTALLVNRYIKSMTVHDVFFGT